MYCNHFHRANIQSVQAAESTEHPAIRRWLFNVRHIRLPYSISMRFSMRRSRSTRFTRFCSPLIASIECMRRCSRPSPSSLVSQEVETLKSKSVASPFLFCSLRSSVLRISCCRLVRPACAGSLADNDERGPKEGARRAAFEHRVPCFRQCCAFLFVF